MAKTPSQAVEIETVPEFLASLRNLHLDPGALFRGQPIDGSLIPRIVRYAPGKDLLNVEKSFLGEFKRRAHPLLNVGSLSAWQLLAYAQHSGAPTRLLDWTRSALAALWFSVAEQPHSADKRPVVWVIKTIRQDFAEKKDLNESPFDLTRTTLYKPDHVSVRIAAQDGYFSVHPYSEKDERYVALEEQVQFKDRIFKFYVKSGREPFLFEELDRVGVNNATLFPDIQGLAKHLAARCEYAIKNKFHFDDFGLGLNNYSNPW